MIYTDALIVGASISGLASASCLQKQNINYVVIERQTDIAAPWRNHYERLHLHTNKRVSNLPYKKFNQTIPRYPTRKQVVDYLEDYSREFHINPMFNTAAESIARDSDSWITKTNNETFKSKYLVVATGAFATPKPVFFKGMETFPGCIIHSSLYKTGKEFKGQKVLVVGFGNSACEIAIDLYEQGATPSMAVRSAVNVIPRDILGVPILEISQWMSRLPPRVADTINAPLIRLILGDITKFGLRKKVYGPFEQISKDGTIPVLDIGIIKHLRERHINVFENVDFIVGKTVHFIGSKKEDFDSIIAATGFCSNCPQIANMDKSRFEDSQLSILKQKYFGNDNLYFCGFHIGPTGHIREIALVAQKVAKDIARKESISGIKR